MFGANRTSGRLLIVLATAVAALVLPAAAIADAPYQSTTHSVSDFDNPNMCAGFVVHGHGVSDERNFWFSDGSYASHVNQVVTLSHGSKYVLLRDRWNYQSVGGASKSEGRSLQLWTSEGRLLYTAAGQLTWSISDGLDMTPHVDGNVVWRLVCGQIGP